MRKLEGFDRRAFLKAAGAVGAGVLVGSRAGSPGGPR
jgi:hypothetical protein